MGALKRTSGLVKILFFEYIGVMCLAGSVASVMRSRGVMGCAPDGSVGGVEIVTALIGMACAAWLVWRILWPKVVVLDFRPNISVGPVVMPNPTVPRIEFSFASTHPSYVFVELLVAGAVCILLVPGWYPPSVAGCGMVGFYLIPRIGLGLALFFPGLRLVSWYVLGRQVDAGATTGKSVLAFWAILAPIVVIAGWITYDVARGDGSKVTTVVNAETFVGGLAAHTEWKGQKVRVSGGVKQLARCYCDNPKDANDCKIFAVLVDLGAAGDAIVHSPYDADLIARAMKKDGKPIEAVGVLGAIPEDAKTPAWAHRDCGFDQFGGAPAGGRVYVEAQE